MMSETDEQHEHDDEPIEDFKPKENEDDEYIAITNGGGWARHNKKREAIMNAIKHSYVEAELDITVYEVRGFQEFGGLGTVIADGFGDEEEISVDEDMIKLINKIQKDLSMLKEAIAVGEGLDEYGEFLNVNNYELLRER